MSRNCKGIETGSSITSPDTGNRLPGVSNEEKLEPTDREKADWNITKPSVQMIEKRCDRSTDFFRGIWSSTVKQTNDNSVQENICKVASNFNKSDQMMSGKGSGSVRENIQGSKCKFREHEIVADDMKIKAKKDSGLKDIAINQNTIQNKFGRNNLSTERRSSDSDDLNKLEENHRTTQKQQIVNTSNTSGKRENIECFGDPNKFKERRITMKPEVLVNNRKSPIFGKCTMKQLSGCPNRQPEKQQRATDTEAVGKSQDFFSFEQCSSQESITPEILQHREDQSDSLSQDQNIQREEEEGPLKGFACVHNTQFPVGCEAWSDIGESTTDESLLDEQYIPDEAWITDDEEIMLEEGHSGDVSDGNSEIEEDLLGPLDYTGVNPTVANASETLLQCTQYPSLPGDVIQNSTSAAIDIKTCVENTGKTGDGFHERLPIKETKEKKVPTTIPFGEKGQEEIDTGKLPSFDNGSLDKFRKPKGKVPKSSRIRSTTCPSYRKTPFYSPLVTSHPVVTAVRNEKNISPSHCRDKFRASNLDDELLRALDEMSSFYYEYATNYINRSFYYSPHMVDFAASNGFELRDVSADGNCMFRAVADQLLVNGHMYYTPKVLRHKAISYLRENPFHEDGSPLGDFLTDESWEEYLQRLARDTVWGDHLTLKALSEVLGRKIMVINTYEDSFSQTELIPKEENGLQAKPFFLSHVGEYHYMSLRPLDWEAEWSKLAKIERMKRNSEESVRKKAKCKHLIETMESADGAFKKMEHKILRMFAKDVEDGVKTGNVRPTMTCIGESSAKDENEDEQRENEDRSKMLEENGDGEERGSAQAEKTLSLLFQEIEYQVSVLENMDSLKYPVEDNEGALCFLGYDSCFVDPVSLMPMPHLSYIMLHTLTEKHIYTPSYNLIYSPPCMETIYIGSAADHTNAFLYDYSRGIRSAHHLFDEKSHECIITLDPRSRVHFAESNAQFLDLIVDSSDVHAGYCRLRPINALLCSENNQDYFIKECNCSITYQPDLGGKRETYDKSYYGYHCPQWPDVSSEWISRDRPAQWPSEDLIAKVAQAGCDVIRRAHPKSNRPAIEWQFIFGRAEKMLLKNLDVFQLYCYKVFKILLDYQTENLQKSLRGTHLKAVFFYSCEEIPESSWKESAGGCVLHLISRLLKCLRAKRLPNFFIKENNMIDHLEDSDIQSIADAVESIRLFPSLIIRFVSERYALPIWSHSLVFKDISRFSRDRDLHRTVHNVFVPTTIKMAKTQAERGYYNKGYELIEMAYDELLQAPNPLDGSQVDIPDFDVFATNAICSLDDSVQSKLIDIHKERTKTDLKQLIPKAEKTLQDLLGSDCPKAYASINVPKGYIDCNNSEAIFLHRMSKACRLAGDYKVAETFVTAAIKKTLKAISEDLVDVSQICEKELKDEITRENCKLLSLLSRNLEIFLPTLQLICEDTNDYQALRGVMDELEEISEREPRFISFVIQAWELLGEKHRARDFQKRMEQLQQKDVTPGNSIDNVD